MGKIFYAVGAYSYNCCLIAIIFNLNVVIWHPKLSNSKILQLDLEQPQLPVFDYDDNTKFTDDDDFEADGDDEIDDDINDSDIDENSDSYIDLYSVDPAWARPNWSRGVWARVTSLMARIRRA